MASTYKILGQQQVDKLNATGGFTTSMEVTFETIPEGIIAKVTIPERNFQPDFVASAITQMVENIQAVQAL